MFAIDKTLHTLFTSLGLERVHRENSTLYRFPMSWYTAPNSPFLSKAYQPVADKLVTKIASMGWKAKEAAGTGAARVLTKPKQGTIRLEAAGLHFYPVVPRATREIALDAEAPQDEQLQMKVVRLQKRYPTRLSAGTVREDAINGPLLVFTTRPLRPYKVEDVASSPKMFDASFLPMFCRQIATQIKGANLLRIEILKNGMALNLVFKVGPVGPIGNVTK